MSTKVIPIYFLLSIICHSAYTQIQIETSLVDTTTIIGNLDTPWEILWGTDDHIWFTEREGKVSRVDPDSGERTVLLEIDEVVAIGESGLLGMALHPQFESTPHVFVVYTYDSPLKEKLVRFTFENNQLISPMVILDNIPAANIHDGSRIAITQDLKILMTTGDAANTSSSQDLNSLNGKILRINLDGSVPDDNPVPGSFIFTMGHRNPQGLVISPSGTVYSSEHGPDNDDEVNIITANNNYGWPIVEGFCNTSQEISFCNSNNVMEPIAAYSPTIAVAGLDFYVHTAIPEWENDLLLVTLKDRSFVHIKLDEDGETVLEENLHFKNVWGRLRDLCIAPDGRVFIATSNRDGRGTPAAIDDRIIEIRNSGQPTGLRQVNEPSQQKIKVFPNPAKREVLYTIDEFEKLNALQVIDLSGKIIVKQTTLPHGLEGKINIQQVNPGIYIFRFLFVDRVENFKIFLSVD